MRSGLQPVAISCNENYYHGPSAALIDARAPSENASDAPNVLGKPILCKKTNFAELAFSEVRLDRKPGSRSFQPLMCPNPNRIAPLHTAKPMPHITPTILVNFTRG